MRFTSSSLALGVIAASVKAGAAAFLNVRNQCPETVYLVYSTEVDGVYQSFSYTFPSNSRFGINLAGRGMISQSVKSLKSAKVSSIGMSVGLSRDPNFYSDTVAKLIMGYTVEEADNLLYYSFANDHGNPYPNQPWSLTSTNPQCTPVSSANQVTYACAAGSTLALTLCV
jgi:hypothetical protein